MWIFIYRYRLLQQRFNLESDSLTRLYMGQSNSVSKMSVLSSYIKRVGNVNSEILKAAIGDTVRVSTKGLTFISIVASTSPFIGLFGTVVELLETFSHLSSQKSASLSVIAPAISQALVATAVGIFVAIFAYSFHLLLKRKAYELSSVLSSQADVVMSKRTQES
ncbi:MAG: MotA/TolQ/ExbB proton channel family protein [Sulfurovum sp.]|nr:MotA/TolQ/ExbB proton channel family protein [Sulfurovum sp.]